MVVNGVVNGKKLKPRVVAVIQARMRSKRLPGKAMLDLAGRPLLAHVIDRAQHIEGVDAVVVATSIGEENAPLIELARSMGADVFVGSVDNVLERYYLSAVEFGGDFIVRVTGDNPFTDPEYASMAVEIAMESSADLCSLTRLPLGTAVEIIKREALEEAYRLHDKPYHREHVTPYIKEHPELFRIERPAANIRNPYPNLRLTVDTADDFRLASAIYDALYQGGIIPLAEIIQYLKKHPGLLELNAGVAQRPMSHAENPNA